MSKIWGIPSPTNRGPQNHLFWTTLQLSGNLTAYIFRTKHSIRYISGQVRCQLELQGVSYIVSKRHELWSTNGFKLEVSFHPPSINSAFHFIARLRRRRTANGTQPHFTKWWMVGRKQCAIEKLGLSLHKKIGSQKNFYICLVF